MFACFGWTHHCVHFYLGSSMITINILCVGNLKEKFWKDAISEYQKRISAYAKLNIIEVKESSYDFNQINKAKHEEAERIKKYLDGYTVALEIDGKSFTSEKFAQHIKNLQTKSDSTITFVSGGRYGIDKSLSNSCNEKLSFSSFTFPHQLMRVILAEQIYRAFTILNGKTYHK